MTDQDLIAKFLAEKGATVVSAAPAYGVDPETDKVRRAQERARREELEAEHRAERYAEQVREAYHVGGYRARDEVVQRWRY